MPAATSHTSSARSRAAAACVCPHLLDMCVSYNASETRSLSAFHLATTDTTEYYLLLLYPAKLKSVPAGYIDWMGDDAADGELIQLLANPLELTAEILLLATDSQHKHCCEQQQGLYVHTAAVSV